MTQIATIPLTALGAYQRTGKPLEEVFTMHLVGELSFVEQTCKYVVFEKVTFFLEQINNLSG